MVISNITIIRNLKMLTPTFLNFFIKCYLKGNCNPAVLNTLDNFPMRKGTKIPYAKQRILIAL